MTPAEVLAALTEAGCRVTVDGDSLRVRGPLTDDLRQAIREHKAALLELLRPATPFPPAGCAVRFVGLSPVILGPHGEDPIDFRRDVEKQAWVHDPGWWRRPARARAARDGAQKGPQEPR